jgi:DNA polymerase-4
MHVDADAYFASVEQALNPKLKGKQVIVGGTDEGRGIVCAASYEAKSLGIKTGMPFYKAMDLCPNAVVVKPNFTAYREFSKGMYDVFKNYSSKVEMMSVDEAYLDIEDTVQSMGVLPVDIGRSIMQEIHQKLGITVSCGVASSKVVAKVASSYNKPHKLTYVPFGKELEFMGGMPVRTLPGVGRKTFMVLNRFGIEKIGNFAALDMDSVIRILGIQGIPLWQKAQGADNRIVRGEDVDPKSISKERSFYPYIQNHDYCLSQIYEIAETVCEKLKAGDLMAKSVFVKIRYRNFQGNNIFSDVGFSRDLGYFSRTPEDLFDLAKELFNKRVAVGRSIRLVGMGVAGVRSNYNLSIF